MNIFSRVTTALAAAAIGALALVGCDEQKIKELEEGLSTEFDVRAKFGEPERIWQEADGSHTLEYNRQPAGAKNYMITIGQDGKMSALRQVLAPHNFEKVQPGMDELAVRRLLVSEGGRSNIGQRCWDMGPARGNAAINAFLQQGIELRLLRYADTEVMRHHLLALLEAELLPRFMFQHLPAPTAQEIALCTERAVDAFMRAYGTPGDTHSESAPIRKSL